MDDRVNVLEQRLTDPQRPDRGTPSYDSPPVVEVSCGVIFEPLAMSRLRLGVFWQSVRDEYPTTEEVEPLPAVIESLDAREATALEFRDQWRDLLVHKEDDRVLQLQRDRLQFNWRRGKHEKEYPRFTNVLAGFRTHLSAFEAFVRGEAGEPIKPSQYEVTYINHIFEDDAGWKASSSLGGILPDFNWRTGARYLAPPEGVDCRLSFLIADGMGRLHVRAQQARRRSDNSPVLVLELTARGFSSDLEEWFRAGHDAIVLGFEDLTSTGVQKSAWRKK